MSDWLDELIDHLDIQSFLFVTAGVLVLKFLAFGLVGAVGCLEDAA